MGSTRPLPAVRDGTRQLRADLEELRPQGLPSKGGGPGAGDHYQIRPWGHQLALLPKDFPDPALDLVALDRVSDLCGDGDPEAPLIGDPRHREGDQMRRLNLPTTYPGPEKLPALPEPHALREALPLRAAGRFRHDGAVNRLLLGCGRGEPLAALGTPPLEHFAPRLGGNALPEAMGAVPTNLLGLIGTLHDNTSYGHVPVAGTSTDGRRKRGIKRI